MTIARPLRAAIVDLDGTMVDTVGDFVVALSSMLAEIGRPGVDDDFVRRTVGKGSAYLVRAALGKSEADPGAFDAALAADPEVKTQLVANTEEAVRRGAFGAPTFFVGERMFFGQDRLDFVRDALLAAKA